MNLSTATVLSESIFPTSEDIIDCMEDTGFFHEFNDNITMGDDFDNFMNNLNTTDLQGWNASDFPTIPAPHMAPINPLNLTCFPIPNPKEKTTTFEFVTVGLLLTLISVFGLVGNIVAIIILSRPAMKGSFSSLLIGK